MLIWSFILVAATAKAIPAPSSGALFTRDWPENCVPGHEFTVSNFSVSTPKSDAANKTTIYFSFSSKQTKVETQCNRSARTWPIYLVRSARERFACDNTSVEFIYDDVAGSGGKKGRLSLMEAACSEGTKKKGYFPIETGGSVDLELKCEDDEDGAKKCESKDGKVKGVYISYASRPHIEPLDPVPWTIGDGQEDDFCRDGCRHGGGKGA